MFDVKLPYIVMQEEYALRLASDSSATEFSIAAFDSETDAIHYAAHAHLEPEWPLCVVSPMGIIATIGKPDYRCR